MCVSNFKRNYTLTADGYLLIPNGEHMLLVDTGAPTSFGIGLGGVPGVPEEPPEALTGQHAQGLSIGWLTDHVRQPFDGLIGAEVLHERTLVINPTERTVELSQATIGEGVGVPIKNVYNVPIFDGVIAGHVSPVIFDTGAPLGFVPKEMTSEFIPVDHIREFYPFFGPFETDVYELPLEIGDERQVLRFGVFPEHIEQMHIQAGMPVLIGLGLLDHYQISVGLREKRLLLERIRGNSRVAVETFGKSSFSIPCPIESIEAANSAMASSLANNVG